MKYFLGVDGGGTKTQFVLADNNLKIIETVVGKGSDFHVVGLDGVCEIFTNGVETILEKRSIKKDDLISAAWGISCFGETASVDVKITSFLEQLLPNTKQIFVNDVDLGLAGSLALEPGIHIVSGTGAIALGKDHNSKTSRCSGWDYHFGDEGSSYWLGINTLRLFSMEADGRKPKGPLYSIIKKTYKLENDFDLIDYFYKNLNEKRDKIAQVQFLLERAAHEGDISAIGLYKEAAYELFITIEALIKQLDFKDEEIPISYSGGTFKAGSFVLEPLKEYLSGYLTKLVKPMFNPDMGAILLASKGFVNPKILENLKK